MPIEIKEINIKADVYPLKKNEGVSAQTIPASEMERLKKEITKEVTQAVLQKIHQSIER